jgi:hypothetical protein
MSRGHALDLGKLAAVWTAWFLAINWGAVAQFLSAVFTLLLILDKLGALAPIKVALARGARRLTRRGADR